MGGQPDAALIVLAEGLEALVEWLRQSQLRLNSAKQRLWGWAGTSLVWDASDSIPLKLEPTIGCLGGILDLPISGDPVHQCCWTGVLSAMPGQATSPIAVLP